MLANDRLSSLNKENIVTKEGFESIFDTNLDEISPLEEDEIE